MGEALESVCILVAEEGIRFEEKDAAPRPRIMLADRVSLQKVLLNLLTNAIHFTPYGTDTLNFQTGMKKAAGFSKNLSGHGSALFGFHSHSKREATAY